MSGVNRASSLVEEVIMSTDTAIKSKEGSVVEIEGRGVLPHDYIAYVRTCVRVYMWISYAVDVVIF